MFRALSGSFAVAPQIDEAAVAAAAAQGFALIVNNRPDGEEPSAPQGAAIAAAAADAGIGYVAIPVGSGGFGPAEIDALALAIREIDGPILAYCRSGTRSTYLWALANARDGAAAEPLIAAAATQGYDISGLRPTLDAMSAANNAERDDR
jgi:uncharacterized protein (TIGR01244 family)